MRCGLTHSSQSWSRNLDTLKARPEMGENTWIKFADDGEAATINYSVPLPGSHTGRRVMEIDVGLTANEYTKAAKGEGEDSAAQPGSVVPYGDPDLKVDWKPEWIPEIQLLLDLLDETAGSETTRSDNNYRVWKHVLEDSTVHSLLTARVSKSLRRHTEPGGSGPEATSDVAFSSGAIPTVIAGLAEKGFTLSLGKNWAGNSFFIKVPINPKPIPRLFIVERYGISTFLGEYGVGRTVKTFTLLPGETTTISLRTWQSTSESIKASSSIIDSHENSARTRFAEQVLAETTDKATEESTTDWSAQAEAKASWGWGSANVSGGASGEYHSGREQFCRQLSEATTEHASDASSKRELSVTSTSERTTEAGSETLVERTITNLNRRRVLNFVFRELNQRYITKFHLKEVRVAFCNGQGKCWREVPLSGLRPFLKQYVVPRKVNDVAQRILKVAGFVFDANDNAINCLDLVEIGPNGASAEVTSEPLLVGGEFPPPTDHTYYRFRKGALTDQDKNPVDGVLLQTKEITMRTDSVVVEALLGQADALDQYAMKIQAETADKLALENQREALLHSVVNAIEDPIERAHTAANLFRPAREQGADSVNRDE